MTNMTHIEEMSQSTETDQEKTHMIELATRTWKVVRYPYIQEGEGNLSTIGKGRSRTISLEKDNVYDLNTHAHTHRMWLIAD